MFFEGAAIVQAGQPVGARQDAQLFFGCAAAPQLVREQNRQRDDRNVERGDQRADDPRAVPPFHVDIARGQRDVEDQRIHVDMTERVPALDAVDRRRAEEVPARLLGERE